MSQYRMSRRPITTLNASLETTEKKTSPTYLLMLLLFFLDPNNPCIIIMGDIIALGTLGFAGECRS